MLEIEYTVITKQPLLAVESRTIWTDAPSEMALLQAAEWWAEKKLPSRKRNLTPSQRALHAALLRALRAERFAEQRAKQKRLLPRLKRLVLKLASLTISLGKKPAK